MLEIQQQAITRVAHEAALQPAADRYDMEVQGVPAAMAVSADVQMFGVEDRLQGLLEPCQKISQLDQRGGRQAVEFIAGVPRSHDEIARQGRIRTMTDQPMLGLQD